MTQILISNNPEALVKALESLKKTATVEAEYGSTVVRGSLETLAHHANGWQSEPCPCLAENRKNQEWPIEVIGVSHFDLDTLGGVMSLMGIKPFNPIFWEMAAFIDLNGVHKADFSGCPDLESQFNAFWAWSEKNRLFAPRDGSVLDCTAFFQTAFDILNRILNSDSELIEAGEKWAENKTLLNKKSFVRKMHHNFQSQNYGYVVLRKSDQFTNHLYNSPDGTVCDIIIAFNEKFKSVTVSCADPIPGFSCCEFVQSLWGEKAGGHTGIAGSPRGQEMSFQDAEMAFERIIERRL